MLRRTESNRGRKLGTGFAKRLRTWYLFKYWKISCHHRHLSSLSLPLSYLGGGKGCSLSTMLSISPLCLPISFWVILKPFHQLFLFFARSMPHSYFCPSSIVSIFLAFSCSRCAVVFCFRGCKPRWKPWLFIFWDWCVRWLFLQDCSTFIKFLIFSLILF